MIQKLEAINDENEKARLLTKIHLNKSDRTPVRILDKEPRGR